MHNFYIRRSARGSFSQRLFRQRYLRRKHIPKRSLYGRSPHDLSLSGVMMLMELAETNTDDATRSLCGPANCGKRKMATGSGNGGMAKSSWGPFGWLEPLNGTCERPSRTTVEGHFEFSPPHQDPRRLHRWTPEAAVTGDVACQDRIR